MDNDMLIEVKVKYDYESYKKFYRFTLFRGKVYKVGPIIFFTILPLAIIFNFSTWLLTGDMLSIISCILLVLLLTLFTYIYLWIPRITFNKSEPLRADQITFRFFRNYIEVDARGQNVNGTDSYQYDIFKRIYQVESAFYMMMVNGGTLIISKQYLDIGQISYLQNLFANRFPDKYKNCT